MSDTSTDAIKKMAKSVEVYPRISETLLALAAERDALRAARDAAARVLHKAGEQFAFYANEHAMKGTLDGDQKAARNQQWAQRCFDAHDAALGEKE